MTQKGRGEVGVKRKQPIQGVVSGEVRHSAQSHGELWSVSYTPSGLGHLEVKELGFCTAGGMVCAKSQSLKAHKENGLQLPTAIL